MIKPQHRRGGFYPASARDYLEPLQMLKGWVDKMVFCDIKCSPRNSRELAELRKTAMDNDLPEPSFFLGDALFAMESLRPVDLFFLRRDSDGEGGSELNLLGPDKLPMVLNLINLGGLLVTDAKNGRDWFADFMVGKISCLQAGSKEIRLAEVQPWREHGLQAFNVL